MIRFEETAISMLLTCIVGMLMVEQFEMAYSDMDGTAFAKGGAFLLAAVGLFIYVCSDRRIEALNEAR